MPPPLTTWDQLPRLHRWYAELDAPDPRPHLVGFAGDTALLLVGLRPFGPGEARGPLVEALALALPLGADRVSIALPGRAWSLDDPVPPVVPGADLRQRVLTQITVDAHGAGPPRTTTSLHPFSESTDDGALVWDEVVHPGPVEGWIPDALRTLLEHRGDAVLHATSEQLVAQAERLHDLGHEVLVPDDVVGTSAP